MSISVRGEIAPRVAQRAASKLRIQLFADGADRDTMVRLHAAGTVDGFTTNPTLMRKAGVTDYETFAYGVLREITDVPISFEVFADDFATMEKQARKIASWGPNVIVKIPITNTAGESAIPLVRRLTADGLRLNVTALMTPEQARTVVEAVPRGIPAILSVFAGRIADTGRDPMPIMRDVVRACREREELLVLWASPREVLNVYQAEECGCHIITATPDLLEKMSLRDKDLTEFSRETVKMFYEDARRAGYQL
jgi:transaldolase